jgi:endogenous inhibitor of DNA gyrase (YacG/DUF329 family)
MGIYDTVLCPCPRCGKLYSAQSKGSENMAMRVFYLTEAKKDVTSDVNRHSPFTCDRCHSVFYAVFVKPVNDEDAPPFWTTSLI